MLHKRASPGLVSLKRPGQCFLNGTSKNSDVGQAIKQQRPPVVFLVQRYSNSFNTSFFKTDFFSPSQILMNVCRGAITVVQTMIVSIRWVHLGVTPNLAVLWVSAKTYKAPVQVPLNLSLFLASLLAFTIVNTEVVLS